MLDNLNQLKLTKKDIELIEAALHTQKKILSVQSEAGGTGARQRLSDLQHLIKRLGRVRPEPTSAAEPIWSQLTRGIFGCYGTGSCRHEG